ncbi:MAG: hypothetical protein Q8930_00305 [Bacillota bacterium]|nr:hypothetical protein [Bacillota bacterium]
MSRYRLDISGSIELGDYSDINDYIELVDYGDSFTVTFDRVSGENVDIICSMLQEKDFKIGSRTEGKGGKVYLSASRKR